LDTQSSCVLVKHGLHNMCYCGSAGHLDTVLDYSDVDFAGPTNRLVHTCMLYLVGLASEGLLLLYVTCLEYLRLR